MLSHLDELPVTGNGEKCEKIWQREHLLAGQLVVQGRQTNSESLQR